MQGSRFRCFGAVNLSACDAGDLFRIIRSAITLAVVGAVVGEFVPAPIPASGYVLQQARSALRSADMFAALVIRALPACVLFWIVDRIESLVTSVARSQRRGHHFCGVKQMTNRSSLRRAVATKQSIS